MRSLLAHFTLLLALLSGQAAAAWTLSGMVVAVGSGDTIKVMDERNVQHTVRLAGIDAPEKFQAYGQRSLDSLSEQVFRRYVTVEMARKGSSPRVGKVLLQGQDVNLEQLQLGLAWYDPSHAQDLSPQEREAYAAAQADARVRRAGLWRDAKPIPPWEFRRGRRH